MSVDGGLRALFRKNLPTAMWQSIETGGTGLGVPDAYYCFPNGVCGWIEFKLTKGYAVGLRPEQVGWAERHSRMGGRTTIAVRRHAEAGKRRAAVDELYLFEGTEARQLKESGLNRLAADFYTPFSEMDWEKVEEFLCR